MKASLLWLVVTHIHIGTCLYFHQPSMVTMVGLDATNNTQFGFSMGFKDGLPGDLIIGAPHYDNDGKVFKCSLDGILNNVKSVCDGVNINMTEVAGEYSRSGNPDQKFMLGASIAATPNYFMACAPLWSTDFEYQKDNKVFFIFGTCFIYNGTTSRYNGLYERYWTHKNAQATYGSNGWRLLIDDVNDILLITKPSTPASTMSNDVAYVPIGDPWKATNSLVVRPNKQRGDAIRNSYSNYLRQFKNFGTGIASGKFFNNETTYALSMTDHNSCGTIIFLSYMLQRLYFIDKERNRYVKIEDQTPGNMFGAALYGADLNNDGLSELIIGAPAHTDDDSMSDVGAIFILLGGDKKTVDDDDRIKKLLSNKDTSRFGTTIAANDLDGDHFPEIFVSAPYENSGMGALYIISGYEITKKLINSDTRKEMYLSNLKFTQKIQSSDFNGLGFSLLLMPDMDRNGCDELTVGSPGNSKVILLRCVPTIKIYATTELIGAQTVREQDNTFVVQVCVNITYQSKEENIAAKLSVINEILGNKASIETKDDETYEIDLSTKKETYCKNVTVTLRDNEAGEYRFKSEVKMVDNSIQNIKKFNTEWVTVSPWSKLKPNDLEISRHCSGDDCRPHLNVSLVWSGSSSYALGSTPLETVEIQVRNDGKSAYEACAWVHVFGAQVSQIRCANQDGGYLCDIQPKPLKRNAEHSIPVILNMTRLSNMDEFINVTIQLREFCNQPENATLETLIVPLVLNTDDVSVTGTTRNEILSDKEILDDKIQTINIANEYMIINNNSVTWKNITVFVTFDEKPYIDLVSSRVSSTEISDCDNNKPMKCHLNLMPYSITKIITTTVIIKKSIVNILANDPLAIPTNISILLYPTSTVKDLRLSSTLEFRKELTLGQDKSLVILISIIIALVVLAVIIIVLWKVGFFKRKQKQELREQIRRMSVKQSTSSRQDAVYEKFDTDIELDDDAFECVEDVIADKVRLQPKTTEKKDT